MVEIQFGPTPARLRTVDLPYTLQMFGVKDEMFDELVDANTKADLLDGVMTAHSASSMRDDELRGFFHALLQYFAEERDLGKAFGPRSVVRLREGRRLAPDIYFFASHRVPRRLPTEFCGAPDLVVEVLTEPRRLHILESKRPAYREASVSEIWLVNPDREEIHIDRKRRTTYTTETVTTGRATSTVLTGFWVDSAWLWADPLPQLLRCLRAILK